MKALDGSWMDNIAHTLREATTAARGLRPRRLLGMVHFGMKVVEEEVRVVLDELIIDSI